VKRRDRTDVVRANGEPGNEASERKCLELLALWCARPGGRPQGRWASGRPNVRAPLPVSCAPANYAGP
jgi:hypothetical protein